MNKLIGIYTCSASKTAAWLITREGLIFLRLKSLRKRIWLTLNRVERGLIDLTIRYVDKVKSEKLFLAISRIVCKILKAFKGSFLNEVERLGYDISESLSNIATSWGYLEASAWKRDLSFIRYLGINMVNDAGTRIN